MSKENNLKDFLADLYVGISSRKPGASKNPQDFRKEIESIPAGGSSEGGSAECSGNHIIEVDELPEKGAASGIYKLKIAFCDLVMVYGGCAYVISYAEVAAEDETLTVSFNTIATYPTEEELASLLESDGNTTMHLYHVESEENIYVKIEGQFITLATAFDTEFSGFLTDKSEAPGDGMYAIGGGVAYYMYHDGLQDVILGDSTGYESLTEGMANVQLFCADDFPADPSPTDLTTETFVAYYIKNDTVNDIYLYYDSVWMTLGEFYNSVVGATITFAGEIHDPSLISAEGYYALTNVYDKMVFESDVYVPTSEEKTVEPTTYDQVVTPDADYLSQVTVKKIPSNYIIPTGTETFTENGTVDVTKIASAVIAIPDKATVYTVQTAAELPEDAVDGSLAIVLGGE